MCADAAGKAGFAAIDLGAGSGRIFFGTCDGFEEIFRFPNTWDFRRTLVYIREGLEHLKGKTVLSLSTDSWAQDFGLLDKTGHLSYEPVSYLSNRAAAIPGQVSGEIPEEEFYRLCGASGLSPIATLSQWKYMTQAEPQALAGAGRLLPVADLVNHALCGVASLDYSLGSAAMLLLPGSTEPNFPLLRRLALETRLVPEGSGVPRILGTCIRGGAAPDFLEGVPVITGIGHDTATAFYGAEPEEDACFISCGSWAMIGTAAAVRPPRRGSGVIRLGIVPGLCADFVSRSGMRCLHNCVKEWQSKGIWPGFAEFDRLVGLSDFPGTFDMERLVFTPDGAGMTEAISAFCTPRPQSIVDFGRAICRSEAELIVSGIRELETECGRKFRSVLVGGGGGSDCNLLAELRKRLPIPVQPGCREAAVRGNLLIQSRVFSGAASRAGQIGSSGRKDP